MAPPKRAQERLSSTIKHFQKITASAKDRDINEADTVTIVTDMLAEMFGYDKYSEITTEYCVRNTYCDLGIKIDGAARLLIEVKSIGQNLKENHVRQVIDYGAKDGTEWVVLTNGEYWQIYKIIFGKPVNSTLVCEFNFLDLNPRNKEDIEKLFLLCREGITKTVLEEFYTQRQATDRFALGALLLNDTVLSVLKRELKRIHPKVSLDNNVIKRTLKEEVIKREIVSSEQLDEARKLLKKHSKQKLRKTKSKTQPLQKESNLIQWSPSLSGEPIH